MYSIVANFLNYPSTGGNSTILYCAVVVILVILTVIIDMIYKLIHSITKSIERR